MKSHQYLNIIVFFALSICAALFFYLAYPAHIRFQEQYQLFEFTGAYFHDAVFSPGGFSDWLGRLFVNFFAFPLAGAMLLGLSIALIWLMCFRMIDADDLSAYLLSLVPPTLLFIAFLSDEFLFGSSIAIILCLALAFAVRLMPKGAARSVFVLLSCLILYLLAGPVAILYAILLPVDEDVCIRISAPALVAICPLLSQFCFHYPLSRLFTGIHYLRSPFSFPADLWLSALGVAVVYYLSLIIPRSRNKAPAIVCSTALLMAAVSFVPARIDMASENTMRYDFLVLDEDWEQIIRSADKSQPDNALSVASVNLALAKTGLLPERQFSFFQSGEKGLFPSYSISYRSLPCISEIYWHLGMVNACQQYIFDAQEAIPDFQKSARCYKRLAETNIVNADYKVAEKYLDALGNTLFYRKWANKTKELISSEEKIDAHPIYGYLRRSRDYDQVSLFNENSKYAMCKSILGQNPENGIARQYLFSLLLLEKDIEGFKKLFDPSEYTAVPKHYQEALLLLCINEKRPLDSLAGIVSESNIKRVRNFISDMRNNLSDASMQKKYGDTYWYYCIFK